MTAKQQHEQEPEVFEIPNTFTRDYPLDKQIELGINDWRAEFGAHVAFGHTRAEALGNLSDQCVHCRRAIARLV